MFLIPSILSLLITREAIQIGPSEPSPPLKINIQSQRPRIVQSPKGKRPTSFLIQPTQSDDFTRYLLSLSGYIYSRNLPYSAVRSKIVRLPK